MIGNWIGAAFLLGLPMVYLYAWKSRTHKHIAAFLRFNLVPTTTIAEEWNLLCYKVWHDVTPSELVLADEYGRIQSGKYESGKDSHLMADLQVVQQA